MNIGSDIREQLTLEWRRFHDCWKASSARWRDGVGSEFERRFIEPMEAEVPAFLRALEVLGDELDAAGRELDS